MMETNILPNYCFRLFLWLLLPFNACTQTPPTANQVVPEFDGGFGYGCNMGYYPPHFYDKQLALLVHGATGEEAGGFGITTIRPGLFDYFLDQWGFDIRKPHFRYYDSIGLRNIAVISGFPAERNRDSAFYCPGERSHMFRDMYKPIWDDGQFGTPVNDANPYALYIWRAANMYKGYVKIWEVWNEPDAGSEKGWLSHGQPGNWWENPPQPCEMAFKAPPYFYIRALRITYEVVKMVDPDAFVAVGGLGWPSFLDVICRYTDEPFGGAIDPQLYPEKGGAYFDCMSFHAYPHLSMFEDRHSDAAIDKLWALRDSFQAVLNKHGYNQQRYPAKPWICSEFNMPRQPHGPYMGSEAAQINFVVKALVSAQSRELAQMHVYSIADEVQAPDPSFRGMGLFPDLNKKLPGSVTPHPLAYAIKTTQSLLSNKVFDALQTAALVLPEHIRGAAFRDESGKYTYVLWAATSHDLSEAAGAVYTFPSSFGLRYLEAKPWHFSHTGAQFLVNARQVFLTGNPLFLSETHITNNYPKQLKVSPNPCSSGFAVAEFWVFSEGPTSLELFDQNGRLIQSIITAEKLIEGPHARLIHLEHLPSGIYFVRLATTESNTSIRLIKP